jgi:hypothetical protein
VRIKWFSESRHLVKKRCHVSTLGVEHRCDQTEVPAAFLTLRVAEDLGMGSEAQEASSSGAF